MNLMHSKSTLAADSSVPHSQVGILFQSNMKTIRKLTLGRVAAATLLLAGCALPYQSHAEPPFPPPPPGSDDGFIIVGGHHFFGLGFGHGRPPRRRPPPGYPGSGGPPPPPPPPPGYPGGPYGPR